MIHITTPRLIEFTVAGVPIAQPRAKATRRGKGVHVYTPDNGIVGFKFDLKQTAKQLMDGPLLRGPLRVDCEFVFPRPSNMIWKTKPMPRVRKVTKPDRDNLDKAILDALTGVVWADDNQVCAGSIDKWIAAGDEAPHTLVTICEIDETE